MPRLSYGEIRARLRLSAECQAPAAWSDEVGTIPMTIRHDAVVIADRQAARLRTASPVEQDLTGA